MARGIIFDMENNNQSQPNPAPELRPDNWYTPLTRVTVFSRVLAGALFLLLPFAGFWLGMEWDNTVSPTVDLPVLEAIQETSTTTSDSLIPNPQIEAGWEEYRMGPTPVSFWYPPETYEFSFSSQNESAQFLLDREGQGVEDLLGADKDIPIEKISAEEYRVRFIKDEIDQGSLEVNPFSAEKPFLLLCYEGSCGASNLLEAMADNDKNFSFEKAGLKWTCVDYYSNPYEYLGRTCTTYHDNMRVDFRQDYYDAGEGYDTGIFRPGYLDGKYPEGEGFKLEAVADEMSDPAEFREFIERYNKILDSITFKPKIATSS